MECRSLDEAKRRLKAKKIISVVTHFLGRPRLDGMRVLDLGCSAGFCCDELAAAGASVTGVDIDVPGLSRAVRRFADSARFVCGDGSALPLRTGSVDLIVFNHIYEHVVDADLVVAEIRRVMAPDGVVYLGLGNRLGIMEPHYRLPLLSYLPPAAADRYVRLTGRGEQYYERYRTRAGLLRMLAGMRVWDYTLPVIVEPARFAAVGEFPASVSQLPAGLLRAALPLVPTYVWVATAAAAARRPVGEPLRIGPSPVA